MYIVICWLFVHLQNCKESKEKRGLGCWEKMYGGGGGGGKSTFVIMNGYIFYKQNIVIISLFLL